MSLNAYTNGKTAKQIVEDCERLARFPKLNLDPATSNEPADGVLNNALAYRWLNEELRKCYLLFDWPGTQTATTLQLTSRSQSLPADFWRLQFDNALFIILDDRRVALESKGREVFFSTITDDSIVEQPRFFYIDRNKAGSLWVDPIPDKVYLAELHYYGLKAKLNSINDVPDFPYDSYLTLCLLSHYYLDQDDSRLAVVEQKKAMMLAEIRGTASDNRESDTNSMWDGRFFSHMPWEYD